MQDRGQIRESTLNAVQKEKKVAVEPSLHDAREIEEVFRGELRIQIRKSGKSLISLIISRVARYNFMIEVRQKTIRSPYRLVLVIIIVLKRIIYG